MMDSHDFRDLYDAYYPDAIRFVHSLLARPADQSVVDEIVQDVFVKVAVKGTQFRGDAKMKTWIFAIARNAVVDRVRKMKRSERIQGLLQSTKLSDDNGIAWASVAAYEMATAVNLHDETNPEVAALNAEEREQVRACIDRLPFAMKAVITCRLLADLTIAETGEVMNWSSARVRVTYSRALRKFRELWEKETDVHEKQISR